MRGRTIAIGDIHGCAAALRGLLALIRPRPLDLIVTLGDYVDRGPDSRGVIDQLIDLGGRCRYVPILGNHDEVFRDVLGGASPADDLIGMGGGPTLDSYGPGRRLDRVPEAHREFLRSCLDWHETARHIFTHGNYDPHLGMAEQDPGTLRWESLRGATPGPHQSGKTVVVGHTAQGSGEVLDLGHLRCIDTYCYGGGWLTALDVRTDEAWQVDRDGKPRRR